MKNSSVTTGYVSSIFCFVSFTIWIFCFTAIIIMSPMFIWSDLSNYLHYVRTYDQSLKYLAQFIMLLFGASYTILINSLYEYVPNEKKAYGRLSILFAAAFMVLTAIHYFVQLSYVRFAISRETTSGLELFLQSNPISVMSAINMLGWTFFLGLSSLFMFLAFKGSGLKRIRYAFLGTTFSCFLAGVGYILQKDIITFVFINLGMGFFIMMLSIFSFIYFNHTKKISS